jgi:hypothetical protein
MTARYHAGDTAYATIFGYDPVDRLAQRKNPDSSTIQDAYGLATDVAIRAVTETEELGGSAQRTLTRLGVKPILSSMYFEQIAPHT